ncbi:hypothetical protein FisN_3Lh605 [Fistulifera solaris]|uniref:Protein arginine methyltransferase NDUFAF7 n=1 Tax=Fistulifera solaris TaxID=1519565 RepID=A0A1Z5J8V6_FISSO|nr:hypothetical protein FisN_3Lh605 [Fistulifera solaris]|eukprot:GAX10386.1 hypothetical protein FisN_3Lh605 [Fistulifera solaris]
MYPHRFRCTAAITRRFFASKSNKKKPPSVHSSNKKASPSLILSSEPKLIKSPPLFYNNIQLSSEQTFRDSQFNLHNKNDDSLYSLEEAKDLYRPDLHLPSAPHSWEGYEPATPLSDVITALIGVTGRPISVAEFMRMALTHPEYGYYTHGKTMTEGDEFDRDDHSDAKEDYVIGGDFITAPEISQIFGECLGVWYYTQWVQQGKPDEWQWLECGPGKGTLTADFLRFARLDEAFRKSCRAVHLIEASPVLRQKQQETLQACQPKISFVFHQSTEQSTESNDAIHVYWHNTWQQFRETTSSRCTFAVCQEFLDALPVYAFEKTKHGYWRERLVDVAVRDECLQDDDDWPQLAAIEAPHGAKKTRFRLVLAPEATPALKTLLKTDEQGYRRSGDIASITAKADKDIPSGSVVEVSPESIFMAQDLAQTIQSMGGAALIIDYGQVGTTDTIRGFTQHRQVPFLSQPGQVDVTADVDFGALCHAIPDQAHGPVGQGEFLMRMGLQERVVQLLERDDVTDEQAEDIYQSMVRLASPEEMGTKYKVMGIVPTGDETPPGF